MIIKIGNQKVKSMQDKQKQPPYRITVIENSNQRNMGQDDLQPIKASAVYPHKQESLSPKRNKLQKSSERCCEFPESFKRQLLRMFFIPLLIVLFLLTIALTFKQNNYQTNDYFYSKNIEINRKIRGVVPPLNQTKQDIFGEYLIGLAQKFSIENRRMFDDWKVELWKNQSMRITQVGKTNQCWAIYKLKFYSSTIFISRIENHIYFDDESNIGNRNLQNITQDIDQNDQTETIGQINNINSTESLLTSYEESQEKSTTKPVSENSSTNNLENVGQQVEQQTSKSMCSVDLWAALNKILYESHIWTFGQKNFYLLEFSQLGEDGNGVLIMKMIKKYINSA